jgi:hypothetical protein
MLNRYLGLAFMVVALGSALDASGQQATEMFIPIGQSPGLSNTSTLIGTLESVDPGKMTVTVSSPSGIQTVGITDRTLIWIDRSPEKQPNQPGALRDLQQGRKVEVKPRSGEPQAVAEWIKVQVVP